MEKEAEETRNEGGRGGGRERELQLFKDTVAQDKIYISIYTHTCSTSNRQL
jgi:hypothetical protein